MLTEKKKQKSKQFIQLFFIVLNVDVTQILVNKIFVGTAESREKSLLKDFNNFLT